MVPCYIEGSPYDRVPWSPLVMTARVVVRYGERVESRQSADREDEPAVIQAMMRQWVGQIAKLAGHPNFEPQFAGRQWKPTAGELAEAIAGNQVRNASTAN
jgi:1-acyl-sn-glycerol-3-phosphate acyltransferase